MKGYKINKKKYFDAMRQFYYFYKTLFCNNITYLYLYIHNSSPNYLHYSTNTNVATQTDSQIITTPFIVSDPVIVDIRLLLVKNCPCTIA